jgi:hypothetical protein
VEISQLRRDEQLALWINAYNACVFDGVLEQYPVKSVNAIKGFFDQRQYQVAGRSLTLNEIEAQGRALGDWRIHFAVVCASSSCPFLRNEAYAADRLNEQLTDQVARFLRDPSRGLRIDGHVLWVSKIFKWYAKDVVPQGSLTAEALAPVIMPYLEATTAQEVQQRKLKLKLKLKFMEYDWSINEQVGSRGDEGR